MCPCCHLTQRFLRSSGTAYCQYDLTIDSLKYSLVEDARHTAPGSKECRLEDRHQDRFHPPHHLASQSSILSSAFLEPLPRREDAIRLMGNSSVCCQGCFNPPR